MTKTQRRKGSKKRKGGRQPVAFVEHPDTGIAVPGLRVHKSTNRYYRIADNKVSRHYYSRNRRKPLDYLRRAIYEHECHLHGQTPTDSYQVVVTGTSHDDWGDEIPVIGSFDEDGRAVNIVNVGMYDLAMHVRKQLDNPTTRKEFAELVGIPELQNIHSLPPVVTPLTLAEMIERYAKDKTFSRKSQTKDAQTIWALFVGSVAADNLEDVSNEALQRYKKAVERKYALRTQKNHYDGVQSILTHAAAVFKAHRDLIQSQKIEFRLNCQNWSQDKRRKAKRSNAKPMKPATFRKMLAQAKKHSKLAYAFYLSAANFAMHGKEVADIRHDDLDLDTSTLSSYREKDSVQRVAVIWKETRAAIKAYLKSDENHEDKEFLFTDEKGTALNIGKVGRLNRKLRKDAKLPDTVKFDGIRSMTSTGMGAENLIAQKWVMGHVTGELDTYTVRDANETKKALTKARKVILGN